MSGTKDEIPIKTLIFSIWTFRSGKVVRLRFLAAREDALLGAGMEKR